MNKPQTWISVFIPADASAFESVHNVLFELGSTGTEECPDGIRAFFPGPELPPAAMSALKGYLESVRTLGLNVGNPLTIKIPDQDWAKKWREGFKPIRVTDRIVIKPPWEPWKPGSGSIVIDIYPRMAFGTGTHETTQLCLVLTEKYLKPGWRVLDIGTGSAVLAIAAAKLGAKCVLALDNDEDAIANAVENVKMNRVEERVKVHRGTVDILMGGIRSPVARQKYSDKSRHGSNSNAACGIPISGGFDLILANIDRPTLTVVIPQIGPLMNPGGQFILSGILDTEKETIGFVLQQNGFRVLEAMPRGEWVGFAGCPDDDSPSIQAGESMRVVDVVRNRKRKNHSGKSDSKNKDGDGGP